MRYLVLSPLFMLSLLGACHAPPPPPPQVPTPVDPWAKLAPSKDWLLATGSSHGDHASECTLVLGVVKAEDGCQGAMCQHGHDLATDWLARCPKFASGDETSGVKAIEEKLAERATAKPSYCAKKLDDIARDGCGDDATCETTAQRWTTRCAKSEGTPLASRIIAHAVQSRQAAGAKTVELDATGCEELAAGVRASASCKDRAACIEALAAVETYRGRCEDEQERPTIATAVHEQIIATAAGKPGGPILVRANATPLVTEDMPVGLADNSGAVILMCEERATELGHYFAARKGCKDGKLVVARAFKGGGGVEVRVGTLEFPDDATFMARYPTVLASGEIDLRDKAELAAFEGELDKVIELVSAAKGAAKGHGAAAGNATKGAVEAGHALARAVTAHAQAIRRSPAFKGALTHRDEALIPVLKEIAKAKVTAARGRLAAEDAAGLIQRAKTRPFADVNAEGTVEVGASTRASRLDTTSILPRAMATYLDAMKPARPRKLPPKTVENVKTSGIAAAVACGFAEKKLQESKIALINCNFGIDTCDAVKTAALTKTFDEARANAEGFFQELDQARTGGALDATDELTRAAEGASCREPWW